MFDTPLLVGNDSSDRVDESTKQKNSSKEEKKLPVVLHKSTTNTIFVITLGKKSFKIGKI